jgi:uncharacterized membrane protein YgdD (TMEM256/DUF423 family)
MRIIWIIAAIAAAEGAAGTALAAAAAHGDQSPLLATASQFLMIHAGAGLGLAALFAVLRRPGPLGAGLGLALQAGVALFALDLALRGFGYGRLFPFAAPLGGSTTILAWTGLAIWAVSHVTKSDG